MDLISEDSLVILMLTSNLLYTSSDSPVNKPLTLIRWNELAHRIKKSTYKRPGNLLYKSSIDLANELSIDKKQAEHINALLTRELVFLNELKKYASFGINVITRADKEYPNEVKYKLKEQSPPYFWYAGNTKNLSHSAIGIVGSREADELSLDFTRTLVEKSVDEGFAVVSGGAKGIDTTSQNHALSIGGKTVSYLHSDLFKTTKKKETQRHIETGALTLLSSVHPNVGFKGFNAMGRNKYIYSHSKATFVVCSSTKGGTWEGALENIKNSWVPVFIRIDDAVPDGNIVMYDKYSNNPLVHRYDQTNDLKVYDIVKRALDFKGEESKYVQEESNDIYLIILPYLEKVIKKSKEIIEISTAMNINKEQAKTWLERYFNDTKADNKLSHKIPIQEELF
jgi:DNA processing protein